MKKLIIFDLDGTLLDTVEDIRFSLNTTLSKHGLRNLSREEVIKNTGFGAKKLVELSVGDIEKDRLEKIYDDYVIELASCDNSRTVLYDGLDLTLKALKSDGYELAVVSNKPDHIVKIVCEDKLRDYDFKFVMGNMPGVFNPKPDKGCVEYCLEKVGYTKEEAIYVGDSEVDVKTYLNANVDGIGVLWGFRTKEVLEDAGCIRLANNALELYDIIISLE